MGSSKEVLVDQDNPGCSLSPAELSERSAQWKDIAKRALIESREREAALQMRFCWDPEVEAIVRGLADLEKDCCSSLGFEIRVRRNELLLQITGPWRDTPWASVLARSTEVEPASPPTREFVRRQYAAAARGLTASQTQTAAHDEDSSCCGKAGESCCGSSNYDGQELIEIGLSAKQSLACGNAVAAADLKEGEHVLDLGSGAGLDVFLSAKRVGASGKVYGLDMTDEMLALARANQQKTGLENIEFLKGCIEQIPLAEAEVDVVVSNCVINLSTDKPEVFKEIFRVLKPGGRIAIADIVAEQELRDHQRKDLAAWAACLAGALTEQEYRSGLQEVGFADISTTSSHEVQPGFSSMIFQARKPLPAGQPKTSVH